MSQSTKQYTVVTLLSVRGGGGGRVRLATLVKAAGCIQLLVESRRSGPLLCGLRLAATLVVAPHAAARRRRRRRLRLRRQSRCSSSICCHRRRRRVLPRRRVSSAAEPAAGGADDDASATRVVTSMAATPSSTSTTWISLTEMRAGGAGVGAGGEGAARPAACIILRITACRYWAASGV